MLTSHPGAGPTVVPSLESIALNGLASCVDCRATVYAQAAGRRKRRERLTDPGAAERDFLRSTAAACVRLRFRSMESDARPHDCGAAPPPGPGRDLRARDRLRALEKLLLAGAVAYRVGPSGRTLRVGPRVASTAGGGWRVGWRFGGGFDQCETAAAAAELLRAAAEEHGGAFGG